MQTNEQGQIAVKRLRQNQKLIQITDEKYYVFIPRHNVCMAWVDPEDVDFVLRQTISCCGNSHKKQFWIASEQDVRQHLFGGR